MNILEAILLGAVEGFTEFLPVSSTGHLTILEKLLGYRIDAPDVTAFTAIIQLGAVLATVIYLRADIARIVPAWCRGLFDAAHRGADYRFGWAVILGSVPIAIVGPLFKDRIETTLRSLWFVGGALIVWSGVLWFADRAATQRRHETDVTWKDTLIIGAAQCLALIPGVSRSGATMSAGLLRDLDRVTVTRLSFFLSVPALTAAGILQGVTRYDTIAAGIGWVPTLVATVVSFAVAYASVTWLLRFVARHTYTVFIVYRVVLGVVVLALVATNTIPAV
ncbi:MULTISPECIES: undecaprenyl-diphosphate phosphatase [Catenuloplanes]|uniref:Undecaprenyl-diphosphatase n=1 Tax=Catenuloplanes niger TaxID=587534 RepID=A0AAE3ZJZ2_9ACTN|nr:undecaprenyl-diphosphate phosphatase [Catenuloplanes niger]MDR7320372.1 undecaprenyl-diphosphatase [Catenuloplanes niger]